MRLFRRKDKLQPPIARGVSPGRIVLMWKSGEEREDGTEVGKIFIYDDEGDPDDLLEKVRWMTQADAEKYAREKGYEYEEM
jgi:hypothetical protein